MQPIQGISLKQGNYFAFVKSVFLDFKASIISQLNFMILNYNFIKQTSLKRA